MKAYIQTDASGNFYNVNAYVANDGFQTLGWETEKYVSVDDIADRDPEHVVVGGIGNVRKRLAQLGIVRPKGEIDYPAELQSYLGRRVWATTLEELFTDEKCWPVFAKPRQETKKFAGKVMRDFKDFIGLIDHENPTEIWCSELVDFQTEWRCFIRYGEILDIRRYKGAWDTKLDLSVVKNAVADFTQGPAAYGLDFGIDALGQMKLVEVNDGHSLGTYGISGLHYAKFLAARWAQFTHTTDYARF
jgi:ATP-grasp domain, R2K clade family 3